MRIVAKFQFTAPSADNGIKNHIIGVLEKWKSRKFEIIANGSLIIRHSGAAAQIDSAEDAVKDLQRDTLSVLEPVSGGNLQTDVAVLTGVGRTAFRCIISVGSDRGILPAEVPLRAPRFVREIVALGASWTVGQTGERIFTHSFSVEKDDLPELLALLASPQRRLPIVAVSEMNGETIAGDLHERISQDLCALAHVVRISEEASWELTRIRGKEWSCYNGAVRIFWPFKSSSDDFRVHPLWTGDNILSRGENAVQARDWIRNIVSRRIIEASTFVADDPGFNDYEVAKTRDAIDQARIAATEGGDMTALATSYAEENDILRARVDDQAKQIVILQQNVETLTIALLSSQAASREDPEDTPPQTVDEAVTIARRKLDGKVAIASETNEYLSELNATAGPPDKILRYLLTLGDLADALSSGSLGQSIPIWLRERGVECSGDSETAKKAGKDPRTRSVNGESVECEFHAKPSDGVSPDRCVRIYFAIASSAPFVKVAYVGRHFT